jgi:hypothetical protein
MDTTISALLHHIDQGTAKFADVLDVINRHYEFIPTAFHNGTLYNKAGENSGSCRVFAFAQAHYLSDVDTLKLFAEHFQAVSANPTGQDHQNIRNFMHSGWAGIIFEGLPLTEKMNILDHIDNLNNVNNVGRTECTDNVNHVHNVGEVNVGVNEKTKLD